MRKRSMTRILLSISLFSGVWLITAPSPASADHGCYRKVTKTGKNAYGWGTPSSLHEDKKYVRTAPKATMCILYSRSNGYTFHTLKCGQSSARLVSKNIDATSKKNHVLHAYTDSVACAANSEWKWDRRRPAHNQCARLHAKAAWRIDASTGTVTLRHPMTQDDDFVPQSGC